MIDRDLVDQVTRLPARQRLELIELLTRSLHDELIAEVSEPGSASQPHAGATEEASGELAAIERLARSFHLDVSSDSTLHQLRGSVPSAAVPMSKDDVREMIADYLAEKHS